MGDSNNTERKWRLVTHNRPDTDALACLWLGKNFLVPEGDKCEYAFVPASECLLQEFAEGYDEVVHMDTGRGQFDQHGKGLKRVSSAFLLAQHLGIAEDPALKRILELTIATDNIENVGRTSVHYYFTGLFHHLREVPIQDRLDEIRLRAFEVFDIFYGQDQSHAAAAAAFEKEGHVETLPNGISLVLLQNKGNQRDAAFKAGADVVVWSNKKSGGRVFYGVQVNIASRVKLDQVMKALRRAEALERQVILPEAQVGMTSQAPIMPGWFLHESLKLILCGSHSCDLPKEDCSRLKPRDVLNIVRDRLARIPK